MLRYFFKNKLKGNQGQLAPFFIILLVLVIIMAMVTVNLSKVAFVKTETANSVDSGALAAGSVMANLFNAIGKANERMEAAYRDFFDEISILFINALARTISAIIDASIAQVNAQQAYDNACSDPCGALGSIYNAISYIDMAMTETNALAATMNEIKDFLIKFHDNQFNYYGQVRRMAANGRDKAIKFGLKFGFMNSGIADKTANRQAFSNFLDTIDTNTDTFQWFDGQGRRHFVKVNTEISPVNVFDLKVTENLYSKEKEIIEQILELINNAKLGLTLAQAYYYDGAAFLELTCFIFQLLGIVVPELCEAAQEYIFLGIQENKLAIKNLKQIIPKIIELWKGLFPKEGSFTSSSDTDAEDQIICWIEDVIHDYLVKVNSKQEHEGRNEVGIWNARYPDIASYSVVSFAGKGQIHKEKNGSGYQGPILRFNASIVDTDKEK